MLPRAFLVTHMVKNMPAMQKTWVPSLGWENPLEESMATHSSIQAWGQHLIALRDCSEEVREEPGYVGDL